MGWGDGYAARWTVREVDARTWRDRASGNGAVSLSLSRDCTDDVPLLESATMELDGRWGGGERWLRVWLDADDGTASRHAVCTLLCTCTAEAFARGSASCELDGRSVLAPCADVRLPYGTYAPAGCDGAAYAARLLASATPAPVVAEGGFELSDHVVFDLGASCLEAAWLVLDAGGWCVQVDGTGAVRVMPKPDSPDLVLDAASAELLMDASKRPLDTSGVPNRYYAVDDGRMEIAVNRSGSDTSYEARGRWVDRVDDSPVRVGGETLAAYAARRLAQARTLVRECAYTREYAPGVLPYSLVRGAFPELGIEGDMRVLKQEVACGNGVTVEETCGMEVVV